MKKISIILICIIAFILLIALIFSSADYLGVGVARKLSMDKSTPGLVNDYQGDTAEYQRQCESEKSQWKSSSDIGSEKNLMETPIDTSKKTLHDESQIQKNKREKQIIYTADYTIKVEDFEDAMKITKGLLRDFHGEIKEETNYRLIVRVPPENFDEFINSLSNVGKIISKFKKAEDVTAQYYDIILRINSKKEILKSFQRLLEQATDVIIKLEIQKEIRRITEEIEQMEGRLKSLIYLISMSTITITFTSETSIYKPQRRYSMPFNWVSQLGIERLVGNSFYED